MANHTVFRGGGEKRRRNIRLLLEYDGLPYHGWQVQPSAPTIQEVLQEVLARITGARTSLKASGRTDAGVHALGQVANFITESRLETSVFPKAIRSLAPSSISVLAAQEVDISFDSQYSTIGKTYRYHLLLRRQGSALGQGRLWRIPYRLNAARMRRAGTFLVGTRDFSSFRSSGCTARNPVRSLRRLKIMRRGEHLVIDVEANGFLRHMVRNIVGTLVEVGRGRIVPEDVPAILEAADRTRAGVTAPPYGLYLASVDYPPPYRWPADTAIWSGSNRPAGIFS